MDQLDHFRRIASVLFYRTATANEAGEVKPLNLRKLRGASAPEVVSVCETMPEHPDLTAGAMETLMPPSDSTDDCVAGG